MLHFLKSFLKPSVNSTPVGVVVICSSDNDPIRLPNRLSTIREAFELAGLPVNFVSESAAKLSFLKDHGIEVTSLRMLNLADKQACMVCSDRQFAVAPEVFQKMRNSAPRKPKVFIHDKYRMLHHGLYGQCILTTGADIASVHKLLVQDFGQFESIQSWAQNEGYHSIEADRSIAQPIYARQLPNITPTTITLETSNACNQYCLFCPYHGERQKEGWRYIHPDAEYQMPMEKFETLLDEIADWEDTHLNQGPRTIVPYWRGELLANPDYQAYCKAIKDRGFRLFFVTNASLLNEEHSRFFLDIGVDYVKISRHGISQEAIKSNKIDELADQAHQNILRFIELRNQQKAKMEIGITCTINENNADERDAFLNYWIQHADFVDFSPENYHCENDCSKKYKEDYLRSEVPATQFRSPCKLLMHTIFVASNGEVMPCIGGLRKAFGNCFERTLKDIYQSSELNQELVKLHTHGQYWDAAGEFSSCRNCQSWYADCLHSFETASTSCLISPVMEHHAKK